MHRQEEESSMLIVIHYYYYTDKRANPPKRNQLKARNKRITTKAEHPLYNLTTTPLGDRNKKTTRLGFEHITTSLCGCVPYHYNRLTVCIAWLKH